MFDLAWSEILIVGLIAVLVLGPKELPQAMRTFANALRKVRKLGAEFQGHFNEMLREAELDDVRKQVQKFSQTSLTDHVTNMIDPGGDVAKQVQSALTDPDQTKAQEQAAATPVAPEVAAVEPPAETPPPETTAAPGPSPEAPPKPPAAV